MCESKLVSLSTLMFGVNFKFDLCFVGIGRVQDMNATNMNVDDWTRKITMARHLLLVYNKIEAPLSLLTGKNEQFETL